MMLDTSHPMFRPLWFRLGLCAFLIFWTGLEWRFGSQTWMVITGVIALFCIYKFLIEYQPPAPTADADDASSLPDDSRD